MKLIDMLNRHINNYVPAPTGANAQSAQLTVSFVVPVFNSEKTIGEVVKTMAGQERADLIQQVVLINDGSEDNTLQVLHDLKQQYAQLPIIVLDNDGRKYSAVSRNRGLQHATGDLVCFVDSDILLPPDYLTQHILQHQADQHCITFSLRSNVAEPSKVSFPVAPDESDFRSKLLASHDPLQGAPFQFSPTHTLAELCLTCSVTYRRADLVRVKGCPENFVGWGFNDTAIAAKVIALGRAVVPMYDAMVGNCVHAPRSGNSSKKWAEFATNKQRYQKMLELPLETVCNTFVPELEA